MSDKRGHHRRQKFWKSSPTGYKTHDAKNKKNINTKPSKSLPPAAAAAATTTTNRYEEFGTTAAAARGHGQYRWLEYEDTDDDDGGVYNIWNTKADASEKNPKTRPLLDEDYYRDAPSSPARVDSGGDRDRDRGGGGGGGGGSGSGYYDDGGYDGEDDYESTSSAERYSSVYSDEYEEEGEDEYDGNASGSSSGRLPTFKELMATAVSGVTMVLQGVSFAVNQVVFVKLAAVVGLMSAPLVTVQQVRMTNHELQGNRFRNLINYLRDEVNILMRENEKLTREIDALEDEVDKLADVEDSLSAIAKKQRTDVNHLVQLTKMNADTVAKMKRVIRAQTLQDITSLVIQADFNQDGEIDDGELKLLTFQLHSHLSVHGIEMNVRLFLEAVREDLTIEGVLSSAKQLLIPDRDEDDNIESVVFRIDIDSFRNSYRKSGTGIPAAIGLRK